MILDVPFPPLDVVEPERKVRVVIDVLTATSTLAAMLQVGCRDTLLKATLLEARASARIGRLLCGDEGGVGP